MRPSIAWAQYLHLTLLAPSQHPAFTGDKHRRTGLLRCPHEPCVVVICGFGDIGRAVGGNPNRVKQCHSVWHMGELSAQHRMGFLLHQWRRQQPLALVAFHQNCFAQTRENRRGQLHVGNQKYRHGAACEAWRKR